MTIHRHGLNHILLLHSTATVMPEVARARPGAPGIDLVVAGAQNVANRRVHDFAPGAEGINYSFGGV